MVEVGSGNCCSCGVVGEVDMMQYCGIVVVVGVLNVGKFMLVNVLVGQKVVIVSFKVQMM